MTTAIDIVLIPPPEIWESAVLFNQQINEGVEKPEIVFDGTHFPHITLVQGCVNNEEIETIKTKIKEIVKSFTPFDLTADHMIKDENGFVSLEITQNEQLTDLHKRLLDSVRPHNKPIATTSLYTDRGEIANELTLRWITYWIEREHIEFQPHITLGKLHGKLPEWTPKTFTTDIIGLYQLGNFCTCRKVLHQWTLA